MKKEITGIEQPIAEENVNSFVWTPSGSGGAHCHGQANYEELYLKTLDELECIRAENKYMYEHLKELKEERRLLEAKMSVVELIFGGNK